jgi:hypothetical protein
MVLYPGMADPVHSSLQTTMHSILVCSQLQWLQDPSKINEENLYNIRREDSRYFRIGKKEIHNY